MVELIRRLDRSRFDVHVACFHLRGPLASLVAEEVTSIEVFPLAGFARPGTARSALAFASWCRRIGARVVHTCELYANIFGLPAAALAGVDVRVGNRREILTPDKTRGHLLCQRLAYKAAHAVVANSTAAAEQLRREGVPARKIRTITNGVDCDTFAPAAPGAPRSRRRVITVANLRTEKGHDTLIDAIPQVIGRRPDTEFVFVGDGPLREELRNRVTRLGVGAHVTFLGERGDVPALLAQSDVFVLPSRSEACPNGILEAMAAGLPIVASRVGGIPELVVSDSTGILVEPDRPEALAVALLSVLDQPERARALATAARVRAERHFSFDRMVSAFEDLYLTELAARAVTARAGRLAASGS